MQADMHPDRDPGRPSMYELQEHGRKFPPNHLHESWLDYLYWDWPEKPIKGFFVRKEAKGHGTDQRIDGLLENGSRVILFEDVTTTGGSVMQAAAAVRQRDCTIVKIIAVVDRLEGADQNFKNAGINFEFSVYLA